VLSNAIVVSLHEMRELYYQDMLDEVRQLTNCVP
jgi:hypothetical protein